MVLDAVSNFVRGNTDASVGTSDTTVSVVDASIFPDPPTDGEFNVVIWDVANFPRPDQDGDVEIVRVTARDTGTNELTVTRGQEMTSAAAHPEGSAIHLSPTAKMFSDIESTFGDFWDAGTQELTADVNNTNTTTQALEAETGTTGGRHHWEEISVVDLEEINTIVSIPTKYDFVELVVSAEVGASEGLDLRVNGESENEYDFVTRSGSMFGETSDATEFNLLESESGTMRGFYGVWTLHTPRDTRVAIIGNAVHTASPQQVLIEGFCDEFATGEIASVEILGDANNVSGDVYVNGRVS